MLSEMERVWQTNYDECPPILCRFNAMSGAENKVSAGQWDIR